MVRIRRHLAVLLEASAYEAESTPRANRSRCMSQGTHRLGMPASPCPPPSLPVRLLLLLRPPSHQPPTHRTTAAPSSLAQTSHPPHNPSYLAAFSAVVGELIHDGTRLPDRHHGERIANCDSNWWFSDAPRVEQMGVPQYRHGVQCAEAADLLAMGITRRENEGSDTPRQRDFGSGRHKEDGKGRWRCGIVVMLYSG